MAHLQSKTSSPRSRRPAAVKTKKINLALQGGGAHGAFTWGVLDRLIEDPRIEIDGISATSAGAMNAVVAAYGLHTGGRDGARKTLAQFWRRIAETSAFSPLQPSLWDRLLHNHSLEHSTAFVLFDLMTRMFSPRQFNPFNFNPLREVLLKTVVFDELCKCQSVRLYLCATNVRTGKVRIFTNPELSVDAVLASACLPFLFHTVEIDGEPYWDGGYMGNPAIFPLIYNSESHDVVVVHINPIIRDTVPQTAGDILNRINELSFNSSLMREMRAIAFVSRLIDEGKVADGSLNRVLIHAIEAEEFMRDLGVSSKLNADWEFLTHLHEIGRERAGAWLDANFARLNIESTVDIRDKYL